MRQMNIGRKISTSFAVLVATLVVLSFVIVRNLGQMDDASRWNDHTYKVLLTADQALAAMVDQETGVRGYLISADDKFLAPYRGGL